MAEGFWVVVVESSETDRFLIESAIRSVASHLEVEWLENFETFFTTLAKRGALPTAVILDWHAPGDVKSCIDSLTRLGFLNRIPLIATARTNPLVALDESFKLGVPRFVCKLPDDVTFKKKVGEAIADYVPGAKKVLPPETVLQL